MLFHEVFEMVKAGKRISRELWAPSGAYLEWLPGGEYLFLVTRAEKTDGKGYAPTIPDLEASDWKELTWEEISGYVKQELV